MNKKVLCDMAISATDKSYSPYSGCKVGAALLSANGQVFTGCNIENASFSPTICAERTAFAKAESEGVTKFSAIAIAAKRGGKLSTFTPCGVCRQVMSEFCDADFKVLVVTGENTFEEYTLAELLPASFKLD